MNKTIRILLCDDQAIVREGLRAILESFDDLKVIGAAHNGQEALQAVERDRPDLVLMDLKMPVMNGIQATRELREKYPDLPVLVLTTYDEDEWVFDAIRSGAAGYLLKDTPRETLAAAVRGTMAGETHVDPTLAGRLFRHIAQTSPQRGDRAALAALSERELDVLRLLSRGFNNAEIAARLYLSEGTVRNYVSAIFTKLGVSDRTQAALVALNAGITWQESEK